MSLPKASSTAQPGPRKSRDENKGIVVQFHIFGGKYKVLHKISNLKHITCTTSNVMYCNVMYYKKSVQHKVGLLGALNGRNVGSDLEAGFPDTFGGTSHISNHLKYLKLMEQILTLPTNCPAPVSFGDNRVPSISPRCPWLADHQAPKQSISPFGAVFQKPTAISGLGFAQQALGLGRNRLADRSGGRCCRRASSWSMDVRGPECPDVTRSVQWSPNPPLCE